MKNKKIMARTRNSETVYLMLSAPPGSRPGGRTYAQTRCRGHRQTHRHGWKRGRSARRHLLRRLSAKACYFTAQDYLMCTPEMARAMIRR
jgi:hypothetical protein